MVKKYAQRTDLLEHLAGKPVGERVRFQGERQSYVIQARDERYLICTKPLNVHHTVMYTIIDLEEGVRSTDDLVFGLGYETREQCEANLDRLQQGQMGLSRRQKVPLRLVGIYAQVLRPGSRRGRA